MTAAVALEVRLHGTRRGQFLRELLGNSAHFAIANLFFEAIIEGSELLHAPDAYVLVGACLLQAWLLGSWQYAGKPRPFLGNLVGPACYTLIEGIIEGTAFFAGPNHIAYWVFSLALGALQQLQQRAGWGVLETALSLAEGVTRAAILLAMYWILETRAQPEVGGLAEFMRDASHVYITLALAALGLLVGLLHSHSRRSSRILHETVAELRRFSEWAWGKDLLERAVSDREVLALRRQTRGIVFIDIRGFTAWSDRQDPETVVDMLNRYYAALGEALRDRAAVKTKYSADEAMVVFANARDAIAAAQAMRGVAQTLLAEYGLSAGTGVHCGATVEGLLGSMEIKLYDVIGDTVNVAKRLCDQAAGGEILASGECMRAAGIEPEPVERRALSVKGKPEPIEAFLL